MAQPIDETEDFADMFEHMQARPQRRIEPGQAIQGTIVHIGDKVVVLDLGGGREGLREEMLDPRQRFWQAPPFCAARSRLALIISRRSCNRNPPGSRGAFPSSVKAPRTAAQGQVLHIRIRNA